MNSHISTIVLLCVLLWAHPAEAAIRNVPSAYPTVQAAVDAAAPGDTVLIAAGTYGETVTTKAHGTVGSRIKIEGVGNPTIRRLVAIHDYHDFKSFRVSGESTLYSHLVYINGSDWCTFDGVTIDVNYAYKVYGMNWGSGGGSNNTITNCVIEKVRGYPMLNMDGSNNYFTQNIVRNGYDVDFVRLFGSNNVIRQNLFENNVKTPAELGTSGFHPDFIQTFGDNWDESRDHIIEQNIVRNAPVSQLTQLSATGQPNIRDWLFRNNVFINIAFGGSCTVPGIVYVNNVFYRCNVGNGGHALNFGRRPFKADDGLNAAHPEYSLTVAPTTSGNIAAGAWYRVVIDETPLDGIVNGVLYKARQRGTGRVIYNGVEYLNGQTFVGTSNPNWSKGGEVADQSTVQVYVEGGITYNGVQYFRTASATNDYIFQGVPGVTTFVSPAPQVKAYRVVLDRSDRCYVYNNAFVDCGAATNMTNGWYAFDTACQNVAANNNFVTKNGNLPVRLDALSRPIGNPGGWNSQVWYELNGKNGGAPGFTDISNFDFRLQPGSQLIDAGRNLAYVLNDFAGTVRPLGTVTDIGAYEYDDGSPPPPPPPPGSPPDPPTMLAPTIIGATAAQINWTDGSSNETSFQLERSLNNTTWLATATLPPGSTTYLVNGLQPLTTYYFRVRSVNLDGLSAWSSVNFNTPAILTNAQGRSVQRTFSISLNP